MRPKLLLLLLVTSIATAPWAHAQCTLTLSEEGIVRINSGEERILTWNSVPGASSYFVQETIEGINEPSEPDFTFGGPYTESHNFEGRGITQFHVNHGVTYKVRYRYTVTALRREDPSWQPCKDDVLFVIEPDAELAMTASLRIVPFAGKTPGRDGSQYSTSLILAGTGLGPSRYDPVYPPRPGGGGNPPYDELPKLYTGQIYFRPLGTSATPDDPHIDYALGGEETLVYEDIMARLGTTGIGTIEVRPRPGSPPPQVDAIIENRMANGTRTSVRVAAAYGRHHLHRSGESATVGIRNTNDTRLAFGVRSFGTNGRAYFERFNAEGYRIDTAERWVGPNMTVTFGMQELFETPLTPGQRIIASYSGFNLDGRDGIVFRRTGGGLLFLTETGNDLNNPGVIYRDPLHDLFFEDGYDPFIVY